MPERRLTGKDKLTQRDAILGQARPANTTAVSLYTPALNVIGYIKRVHICNTTGSSTTFRLFVHQTGTTYDQTTALEYDKSCGANNSVSIDFGEEGLPMNNNSGNFAVATGTNSALTFTAWGYELLGSG